MGDRIQPIRDPSQLSTLSVWRLMPPRQPPPISIEAEGPSTARIREWEGELRRLQSTCGCEQGAVGLIVGAVGCLLFLLLRPGGWGSPGRTEFWIGLGVLVTATSVGKFLGLLAAQARLRRVVREIQSQWRPQQPEEPRAGSVETRGGSRVWPTRCCGQPERAERRIP